MVGTKRNFGLDVARAVSILFVLAAHKFSLPIELGKLGVQIFFILSGFLIGQILINDFSREASGKSLLKFWKRRWYRTLPLYYLVLAFKIFTLHNPYGWKVIVYFFFLQANFIGIDLIPVSWSLVVEEWFYIFLPLAVILFFRRGVNEKKLMTWLIILVAFFLAVRIAWTYFEKGIIVYQFDCLLLGVLLAQVKIKYNWVYVKLNSSIIFLCCITCIAGLVVLLGKMQHSPLYSVFHRVLWYFFVSIFIVFTIPFLEQSPLINISLKKLKPLYFFFTWTSILTYSMYLLHQDIYRLHLGVPYFLELVIQMFILYTISFIVYRLYEHPMMSLREDFSVKQYFSSVRASA